MKKSIKVMLILFCILLVLFIIAMVIWYALSERAHSKPIEGIEDQVSIVTVPHGDRNVYTISRKTGSTSTKHIIYLHGGAYTGEMTESHWKFVAKIVNDTGYTVIVPDYPLAPKYRVMDIMNFVKDVYIEEFEMHGSEDIVLMGDSAGGGLALALCENIAKTYPNTSINMQPSKIITISPWVDVNMNNPDIVNYIPRDTELNIPLLLLAGKAYAGDMDTNNYLISPIYGDLSIFKNLYIFYGGNELFVPDIELFANKVAEQGGNVELTKEAIGQHIYLVFRQNYNSYINLLKILS